MFLGLPLDRGQKLLVSLVHLIKVGDGVLWIAFLSDL